jgi:DNA-binding NtrC family response regulator
MSVSGTVGINENDPAADCPTIVADAASIGAKHMPANDDSSRPPLDVLIVDDEAGVRELLAEHLLQLGCRVTAVEAGSTAVEAIRHNPARYALVLTDLQLPGVDGLAVLKAAKAANAATDVVLVTGYASIESAIEAVRHGAYDYLTKPFSLGQLDLILRRLRDRQALEAENRRLLRRLGQRDGHDPHEPALASRLDAIDGRLSRIEQALRHLGA